VIRINLLQVERREKIKLLPLSLISGIIIFGVTALILGLLTLYLTSKIGDIRAEKVSKEKRLSELKAMIKEVEDYERDNKTFQENNTIIEQLKRNQHIPLRLLDEVSAMLPNGVWLFSLHESGGNVNIEGYAFTNPDLVNYVENLKGSKHLEEVALIESRHAVVENIPLYQFKLTFKVKA